MRQVQHSALIVQTPGRVFSLINDIESYPRFIPWCTHASVLSRSEREIIATIGVRRGPLRGEFTTRNELEPDRRILMHLVSGPFRMLEGEWLLSPVGDNQAGCRVQLTMKFAFSNPLTALLFEQQFAETAASLLDAFVARARTLPP
ncbi:MAG TPA: type II toxin-antitoxin system RatA family toxin [Steroidobacteraceae bacterium]|nr:type II toxin-antitoxin system RatA family toxin [Steroidobacteraceae bacterium]